MPRRPFEAPVAAAGVPPQQLQRVLDRAQPGAFQVNAARDRMAAETLIRGRDADGALVPPERPLGRVLLVLSWAVAAALPLVGFLSLLLPRSSTRISRARSCTPCASRGRRRPADLGGARRWR
jgi:hypothetical protein